MVPNNRSRKLQNVMNTNGQRSVPGSFLKNEWVQNMTIAARIIQKTELYATLSTQTNDMVGLI